MVSQQPTAKEWVQKMGRPLHNAASKEEGEDVLGFKEWKRKAFKLPAVTATKGNEYR